MLFQACIGQIIYVPKRACAASSRTRYVYMYTQSSPRESKEGTLNVATMATLISKVLRCVCPQRLGPCPTCNQTTGAHPSKIPTGDTTARAAKVQGHWQPSTRNHQVGPPPRVKLGVFILLVLGNSSAVGHHLCPDGPPVVLQLPLTR